MEKIVYLEKRDEESLPPDAPEDVRIESAVRWINRKVQATVHFGLLQIGYYLLNNFFGGSIEEALSRNPNKHHSFRRLCKRPDLLISSTHLVNAVKLVVQEKQLGSDKSFQALAVSHKIALLTVKDLETKRALAERTVGAGLSVRELAREARAARGLSPSEADAWARCVRRALNVVLESVDGPIPEGLSPAEAAALDRAIFEARRRLQGTLATLRGIRSIAV